MTSTIRDFKGFTSQHMNKARKQILISIGDKHLTATLNDSPAAEHFAALLPLTFTMTDLFGQQKYVRLPNNLPEAAPLMQTFEVGHIAYWSPGPGISIFYGKGRVLPDSGLYLLGKIESGLELHNKPGSIEITIELVGQF